MSRSMPSPAERWLRGMRGAWRIVVRTARLAVGIPDYDTYVAHVRERHTDVTPMSRAQFHHERVQARYGRGRTRCC